MADDRDDKKRSAAVPAAVAGASRPRFGEVTIRDRGRLPHWEREGGLYFVTFRVADSLPQHVCSQMRERKRLLESARLSGRQLLECEEETLRKTSSKTIESLLDAGTAGCVLLDRQVAGMVAKALKYWDGKRYGLIAWCVMPNHVHVLFRLVSGEHLATILSSWKSYTAKEANRLLQRTGKFWEREYWDTLIRNGEHLERAIAYIESNPQRAGLSNWPWVSGPQ